MQVWWLLAGRTQGSRLRIVQLRVVEVLGCPGGSIVGSAAGRSFDELGFLRGFSFLLPSQEPPDTSITGECAGERATFHSFSL